MLTKKSFIKYTVKMYIITFWTETSDNLVENVIFCELSVRVWLKIRYKIRQMKLIDGAVVIETHQRLIDQCTPSL